MLKINFIASEIVRVFVYAIVNHFVELLVNFSSVPSPLTFAFSPIIPNASSIASAFISLSLFPLLLLLSEYFCAFSCLILPPPLPFLANFLQLLLQLLLAPHFVSAFSASQRDCQVNELFIECGTCEGSCREPIITNCRKECKPPRCECRAKLGYVRAHDGACVPFSECATYKGTSLAKDGTRPLTGGANANKEQKEMHSQLRNEGKEAVALPPSIRPPSASLHHSTKQHKLQDQVIQVGPSPPVIVRPSGQSHPVGTSHMNLFADLANANFNTDGTESDKTETTTVPIPRTIVHSVSHSQPLDILLRQSSAAEAGDSSRSGRMTRLVTSLGEEEASENAKLAKCGERRCSTTPRELGERGGGGEWWPGTELSRSNAFLFAYVNRVPSAASSNDKEHFVGAGAMAENDGIRKTGNFEFIGTADKLWGESEEKQNKMDKKGKR
ncbi:hypothetical protein niasHT_027336 [Heterodera trifolii]|uniref:TIL domain-containing protein n=1 Tax=Heterodera trifolii TaxID=157864 RepID=A0ABD2JTU2_9BILA